MIAHKNCGGQVVSREPVIQNYIVDSIPDEQGFFDSGDLINSYESSDIDEDYMFECFKCSKNLTKDDMVVAI